MEINKGVRESRTLVTRPADPESLGFPFVAQAALLTRQGGGKPETVALATSLTPQELGAAQWLQAKRQYWGIENGLHQRLDVSHNDDHCRLRNANGLWLLGMFRRLSNSLCVAWLLRQEKPEQKTTTDFQTAMVEDNLAKAMRFITSKHPKI